MLNGNPVVKAGMGKDQPQDVGITRPEKTLSAGTGND